MSERRLADFARESRPLCRPRPHDERDRAAAAWRAIDPNGRALARVYAGWGFSEPFYRHEVFKAAFGASSVEEFIETFWEAFFTKCDANNLLAQVWTWEHNDISAHPRFAGDFEKALSSIKARTILVPAATDTYFPPVDNEFEAKHIPHAEVRPIPSIWGHMSPMNPDDQSFIDRALADALV